MPKYEKYPWESQEEADARISENIEEEGFPTANAIDRTETYQLGGEVQPPTAPSMPQYKKGGKVKSKKVDVTDVAKDVAERQKNLKWLDKEIKSSEEKGTMMKTNIEGQLEPRADFLKDQKKKYKEPSKRHIKEKAKEALHAKRRKKGKKK